MYRCKYCGSANVQHAMWVNLNSNNILEPYGTWNEAAFCADCQEHSCIEPEPEEPEEPKKPVQTLVSHTAFRSCTVSVLPDGRVCIQGVSLGNERVTEMLDPLSGSSASLTFGLEDEKP